MDEPALISARVGSAMIGARELCARRLSVVTAARSVPTSVEFAAMSPDEPEAGACRRRRLVAWTRWSHARVLVSIGVVFAYASAS